MILIELFRLAASILFIIGFAQGWSKPAEQIFEVVMCTTPFLSIAFAFALCIHLANLILHFQKSHDPEREMIFEKKQRRLHCISIAIYVLISVLIVSLDAAEVIIFQTDHRREIHCLEFACQAIFFGVAAVVLISMYRNLTECFNRSNYQESAITQWQNYLKIYIVVYGVMTAVNLVTSVLLASEALPNSSI